MPRVSIIIPTYNHSRLVGATLDSVFAQTFTDYEVIVVDDGSTDQTADILKPLADAGKIRSIRQPNAGQAAARNRGVSEAVGEFIAFLDDDDLWPADKLAWQVELLQTDQSLLAVGGSLEVIGLDGSTVYTPAITTGVVSFESLFDGNPFWSPGQTLIRTVAFRAAGQLDLTVPGADDFDLWLKLSRAGRILADPRPALRYRMHAANASNNLPAMHRSCTRVAERHLSGLSPVRSRPLRRSLARWLYQYLGGRTLHRLNADAAGFSARSFVRNAVLLCRLVRPALLDSQLRRDVWKDIRQIAPRPKMLRGRIAAGPAVTL